MDYDLKIMGGTIIDGSGRARYSGDVGIRDGTVVALGEARGTARRTIDASGLIVAPGFVDIHTHYDAQIFWDPMLSVSPWHGVTSVVVGNCGFGIAPTRAEHHERIIQSLEKVEGMDAASLRAGLGASWPFETMAQYLDAIEARGVAVNMGALAGHTPLRFYVMGDAAIEREATPAEVARMREVLRESLRAGALGFSTSNGDFHIGYGGRPVASRYASLEEIRALAGVLTGMPETIFVPHIGKALSVERVVEIAREIGVNVAWVPLIADLVTVVGEHRKDLATSNAAAAQGVRISPQISPKPVMFEYQFKSALHFEGMDAFRGVSKLDVAGKCTAFLSEAFRASLLKELEAMPEPFVLAVKLTTVGEGAEEGAIGKTLAELGSERGQHPIEVALDLAVRSNLEARFRMPLGNFRDQETEFLLSDPHTVIGLSDAGAHTGQFCDASMPTFFLRRWVREMKSVSLERAVHMLTMRPADMYHLKDRGRLAAGFPADVVLFHEETVGEGPLRRVADLPANGSRLVSDALGIHAVIVNGVIIREGNRDTVAQDRKLPGKVLRRKGG